MVLDIHNILPETPPSVTVVAVAAFLVYCATGVIYRLYFHPLAKFPGPKLAAATLWYEFYYDCIQFGQYTFKIKEMHEKYGPLVRISPDELHCNDPEFIETLNGGPGHKRDKSQFFCNAGAMPGSTVFTVHHDLHRARRQHISNFFSKTSVRRLEPLLLNTMNKLVKGLSTHKGTGKPVSINAAYAGFATDVITEYAFANCYNLLDDPTFSKSWHEDLSNARKGMHWIRHFPFLFEGFKKLPRSIARHLNEGIVMLGELQQELRSEVSEIIRQHEAGIKPDEDSHATIFHALLDSKMPEEEKKLSRLGIDGFSIMRAGIETTAAILTTITYYLLDNPEVLLKLRKEVETVWTDPDIIPPCSELENLPYLTGVVQEGLRLGYGAATRLQRIAPQEVMQCGDWAIPPGTSTGMTALLMHHNEDVFPDSHKFEPQRWVDNPRLDKYLLTFSKGTRICAGINLAYSELYLVTAGIFRKLDMELFETDYSDVEVKYDNFTPKARFGSKGIRVLVK